MVKERDQDMINAGEKEREEMRRARRERWERVKRRASSFFAVALLLLVIGGGGFLYFADPLGWRKPLEEEHMVVELPEPNKQSCFDHGAISQKAPDHCIRVFFATSRDQLTSNKWAFGESPAFRRSFGFADVAVPILLPKDRMKFFDGSGQDVPVRSEGLRDPRYKWGKNEKVTIFEYSDSAADKIDTYEAEYFFEKYVAEAKKSSNSALLYIHGMDQSFDQALVTAAQLTVDLTFSEDAEAESLVDPRQVYKYGQPIVFTWPTDEFEGFSKRVDAGEIPLAGDSTVLGRLTDGVAKKRYSHYFRQRDLAEKSSEHLYNTLNELLAQNDIETINVVVHSMGNRVLLNSLALLHAQNSSKTIRIMHVGAEPRYFEYGKAIKAAMQSSSGRTTNSSVISNIYSSSSDDALKNAYRADWASLGTTECPLGTWGDAEIANVRYEECYVPYVYNDDNFLTIDVTGFHVRFPTGLFEHKIDDLGHGYFENSPAIIADISCALDPQQKSSDRSLAERSSQVILSDAQRWEFKPPFEEPYTVKWAKYSPKPGSSSRCSQTTWRGQITRCDVLEIAYGISCDDLADVRDRWQNWWENIGRINIQLPSLPRLKLASAGDQETPTCYETLANEIRDSQKTNPILFELQKANLEADAAKALDMLVEPLLSSECSREVVVLVEGFADTAGESFDNNTLSQRRADAAKAFLEARADERGVQLSITAVGLGSTSQFGASGDDEVSEFGGLRQPFNRRIRVSIERP
ncbi:MAG: alpha/beta hydrolase [Parvularculaceae bacterium]